MWRLAESSTSPISRWRTCVPREFDYFYRSHQPFDLEQPRMSQILPSQLDLINEGVLRTLCTDRSPESQGLEFKLMLPPADDDGRAELATVPIATEK